MEFGENVLMRKETEQENSPDGYSATAPHPQVILVLYYNSNGNPNPWNK